MDLWDGAFQYSLYTNDNNNAPGVRLARESVTITPFDTGTVGPDGRDIFRFQFDFVTPFHALAGQTYWLAAHPRADFRDNDGIFWQGLDHANGFPARFAPNGDETNFISVGSENAFFLTGPGVPEPQTWALLILGFGAVGAALRGRTRPAVAAT